VLQEYVSPPFLLAPFINSPKKKFSFGVYTHVTLDPFTVLIHDELLVLFASYPYNASSTEPLSHLTNGLLNQRLNPSYDAFSHVWKGDQFRNALVSFYTACFFLCFFVFLFLSFLLSFFLPSSIFLFFFFLPSFVPRSPLLVCL
jgi:hypothetical protein